MQSATNPALVPSPVSVTQGDTALVLAIPHGGTFLPDAVRDALNATGREIADTDWHLARLYSNAVPGATIVAANFHRYLIDANRDPSGISLYPGQNTTGLVPLTDFEGVNIWDLTPDATEIERRRVAWHEPYHAALNAELQRVQARHGRVVLFDCHSIRSQIPFLFDGRLPDLNIGTDHGKTCDAGLEAIALRHCSNAPGYSHVLNGRFRGGWTVRHYGRPDKGCHAIQLEISQSTYMHETPPWEWDEGRATRLRAVLSPMLAEMSEWKPASAD